MGAGRALPGAELRAGRLDLRCPSFGVVTCEGLVERNTGFSLDRKVIATGKQKTPALN
jgi:hypothetical protein